MQTEGSVALMDGEQKVERDPHDDEETVVMLSGHQARLL
jgi:hypothetical protein